jgi:sialic acid synthase SpsE
MNNKVNIIAEIGINHQGNFDLMKKMMLAAKKCGVDYIKSQKREPKVCLTDEQYKRPYNSPHSFGKTYGEHKENLEFSIEQWKKLFTYANEIDVKMFMSVFDEVSANKMNEMGMNLFKIGSAEVTKLSLLDHIKSFNKPIIISSGMSTIEEIDEAVKTLSGTDLTLMHCTSAYPCEETDVNLNVIKTLQDRYGIPVGLSGHYNQGSGAIESAAVALGCRWIERHFTLVRTMKGTDQSASLEEAGMKRVVKSVRSIERALGSHEKRVLESEKPIREKCRG